MQFLVLCTLVALLGYAAPAASDANTNAEDIRAQAKKTLDSSVEATKTAIGEITKTLNADDETVAKLDNTLKQARQDAEKIVDDFVDTILSDDSEKIKAKASETNSDLKKFLNCTTKKFRKITDEPPQTKDQADEVTKSFQKSGKAIREAFGPLFKLISFYE